MRMGKRAWGGYGKEGMGGYGKEKAATKGETASLPKRWERK